MLLFEEKVSQNRVAFIAKVKSLASKLRINPNWLMALINSETGGTFKPDIYNMGGSGAVGLIQFMPKTAIDLGTTTSYLASLSNVEQLDWVEKYIKKQMLYNKITQIADYDDLYLLIFYPAAVGKPESYIIPLNKTGYAQNKGIDMNNDGVISIADFKRFIRKNIPTNYIDTFTQASGLITSLKSNATKIFFFTLSTVILFGIVAYFYIESLKTKYQYNTI